MPNWCFTQYIIKSDDKNALKDLEKKLNDWTQENYIENGFGPKWLGNIVGHSGLYHIDPDIEWDDNYIPYCRGTLDDCELTDEGLYIETETAWSADHEMIADLIKTYIPDAEVLFTSELTEDGEYVSNYKSGYILENGMYGGDDEFDIVQKAMKKHFGDEEIVDVADGVSEDNLRSFLLDVLEIDDEEEEMDIEELIEEMTDKYEDFSIHKYEFGAFYYSGSDCMITDMLTDKLNELRDDLEENLHGENIAGYITKEDMMYTLDDFDRWAKTAKIGDSYYCSGIDYTLEIEDEEEKEI